MLPFAKMIRYGNILPPSTTLLDIDFSTQSVGDTFIRDNAGTQFPLTAGKAGIVQYDSTIGKNVFVFNNGYYRCAPFAAGSKLDLSNKDFEVVVQFKSNTTAAVQGLWETGNYGQRRILGISCYVNQFPSQYFQYFIDDGAAYNRVLLNGSNPMVWDTITMTRIRSVGITLKSQYYNSTQQFPTWGIGAGYCLSIGGSYVNYEAGGLPYFFNGSIAKLKITEIK